MVRNSRPGACRALTGVALLAMASGSGAASTAREMQPLESLRTTAARFAMQQASGLAAGAVEARAGRLDPRLRLRACDAPLEAFPPNGGRPIGNVTVGVRCAGPEPWTIYVPVSVAVPGDVLVAARYLPRGEILRAGDLRVEQRDLGRLHGGYLSTLPEALGKRLERPLSLGAVLNPASVAAPTLVRRGTRVTIVARQGGLELRAAGKALGDGAQGDTVQVRNSRSKRLVEGVVTAPGVVRVRL